MGKIAFVVPVFNTNNYLKECLESIAKIKTPKEVIVIDDCGVENPKLIFDIFSKNKDFKFIKNHRNLGLGFTRNEGLKSIGENVTHVFFLDSDDYIDASAFDSFCEKKLKPGKTFFLTQFFSFDRKKIYKNDLSDNRNCWRWNNFRIPGAVWGNFYSVDHIKNCFFETRSFEDLPFQIKILKGSNDNFEFFDNPLVFYRLRQSSISNAGLNMLNVEDKIFFINLAKSNLDKSRQNKRHIRWHTNQVLSFLFSSNINKMERKTLMLKFQNSYFKYFYLMVKKILFFKKKNNKTKSNDITNFFM